MSIGARFTTILQIVVSELPFASTTFVVKLEVVAAVGVPLITPVELFSAKPAGSAPEMIENVNGAVPPVTENVEEYAVHVCALPALQEPHSISSGSTTTIVQVAVSVLPLESVTFEVKV